MKTKELIVAGERLMHSALREGATGVSCRLFRGEGVSVTMRDGTLDMGAASSDKGCALRVLVGGHEAAPQIASLLPDDLDRMAKEAVAMARLTTENKHLRLSRREEWACDPKEIPRRLKALEFYDGARPRAVKDIKADAVKLDRIARAYPGVTRTAGSTASYSRSVTVEMTSLGFLAVTRSSQYGKGTSVIAERGSEMQSASDGDSAFFLDDLRGDEECARRAGEEAVALLGAAPIPTAVMPIVFDRQISRVLLRMFFGAISARLVYRKSTFLLERLHTQVFSPEVTIVDEPHLKRRRGSGLFDGEHVGMQSRILVDAGVPNMWVADIEHGSKMGISSTGHASGPANLSMLAGNCSRDELLSGISRGLLVTSMLGHGANMATGDISVGAQGFLIERGVITRPVNKVTIAGNLLKMFAALRPASDMTDDGSVRAPSCYVGEMTVGGK